MIEITSPLPPLDDKILELSKRINQVRTSLQAAQDSLPEGVFLELSALETDLQELGQKMDAFDEERANLLGLTDISQVVNSALGLDDVLRIVMDTIVRLTGAERGFLLLRDEVGQMSMHIARNWEKEAVHPSEYAISRTVVERVIEDGQAILTTNAQEDPRFDKQESVVMHNLRSILCVPLKLKDELVGVIYTDNRFRSGIFTEAQRDMLGAFANQAAVALENARLIASLRHTLAEVTGLKNLMDNIFASIASGVITTDIRDDITLCNRAAELITGYYAQEIVGRRLSEVLPDITALIHTQLDEIRLADRTITGLEVSHVHPRRGKVDWLLSLSPLKDADNVTQGIAIVLDDLTEKKRLVAQRSLFERMISPAVIEQLNPDSLQLGGRRTDLTILFADIRGFTGYSEQQSPEELVSVLNRYLAAAAEAVLAHGGTVDKFLGDAVMAWFNAPIPQPDHALRAVRTALAMRQSITELYSELPPEAHLSFGIGIHYGEAVLGLIGTEQRLEYTAIGDSVNTAKRLQEHAGRNQIIISADALALVKDHVAFKQLEPVSITGKRNPVAVFEISRMKHRN